RSRRRRAARRRRRRCARSCPSACLRARARPDRLRRSRAWGTGVERAEGMESVEGGLRFSLHPFLTLRPPPLLLLGVEDVHDAGEDVFEVEARRAVVAVARERTLDGALEVLQLPAHERADVRLA